MPEIRYTPIDGVHPDSGAPAYLDTELSPAALASGELYLRLDPKLYPQVGVKNVPDSTPVDSDTPDSAPADGEDDASDEDTDPDAGKKTKPSPKPKPSPAGK